MKIFRALCVAAVLGAGFGATVSLINDLSSPYGELGGRLVGSGWTAVANFMDSVLRDESASEYLGEARYWWRGEFGGAGLRLRGPPPGRAPRERPGTGGSLGRIVLSG
jgi:hypothetical protein